MGQCASACAQRQVDKSTKQKGPASTKNKAATREVSAPPGVSVTISKSSGICEDGAPSKEQQRVAPAAAEPEARVEVHETTAGAADVPVFPAPGLPEPSPETLRAVTEAVDQMLFEVIGAARASVSKSNSKQEDSVSVKLVPAADGTVSVLLTVIQDIKSDQSNARPTQEGFVHVELTPREDGTVAVDLAVSDTVGDDVPVTVHECNGPVHVKLIPSQDGTVALDLAVAEQLPPFHSPLVMPLAGDDAENVSVNLDVVEDPEVSPSPIPAVRPDDSASWTPMTALEREWSPHPLKSLELGTSEEEEDLIADTASVTTSLAVRVGSEVSELAALDAISKELGDPDVATAHSLDHTETEAMSQAFDAVEEGSQNSNGSHEVLLEAPEEAIEAARDAVEAVLESTAASLFVGDAEQKVAEMAEAAATEALVEATVEEAISLALKEEQGHAALRADMIAAAEAFAKAKGAEQEEKAADDEKLPGEGLEQPASKQEKSEVPNGALCVEVGVTFGEDGNEPENPGGSQGHASGGSQGKERSALEALLDIRREDAAQLGGSCSLPSVPKQPAAFYNYTEPSFSAPPANEASLSMLTPVKSMKSQDDVSAYAVTLTPGPQYATPGGVGAHSVVFTPGLNTPGTVGAHAVAVTPEALTPGTVGVHAVTFTPENPTSVSAHAVILTPGTVTPEQPNRDELSVSKASIASFHVGESPFSGGADAAENCDLQGRPSGVQRSDSSATRRKLFGIF